MPVLDVPRWRGIKGVVLKQRYLPFLPPPEGDNSVSPKVELAAASGMKGRFCSSARITFPVLTCSFPVPEFFPLHVGLREVIKLSLRCQGKQ